jgi:pimeloyl-ACP methyl ester carboxylesterase
MKLSIKYAYYGFVALLVLTLAFGVFYEMLGRKTAIRNFPPPGKLVDIGGRRIHLDCRGSGSPTVVFESGLNTNGSLSWLAVHDEIAKTTKACAYSRAGIMWSDTNDSPQNGKSIAEDLHAALTKADEERPFVLVGHSLGGPYIMTYTKYFGEDVAGVVFVDASHPDQIERFKDLTIPVSWLQKIEQKYTELKYKTGATLHWTGVVRVVSASHDKDPQLSLYDDQAVKAYASTSLGAMLKEDDAIKDTLTEAGTFRKLGGRPLFVLTAMKSLPDEALAEMKWSSEQAKHQKYIWKQMQDEEATWSTDSQHQLVPDAGHYIQFDRPDVVVAAVRSVVEKVLAKRDY